MREQPRSARRTQNRVVGLFRDTLDDRQRTGDDAGAAHGRAQLT